jgi:hypothetical protein
MAFLRKKTAISSQSRAPLKKNKIIIIVFWGFLFFLMLPLPGVDSPHQLADYGNDLGRQLSKAVIIFCETASG